LEFPPAAGAAIRGDSRLLFALLVAQVCDMMRRARDYNAPNSGHADKIAVSMPNVIINDGCPHLSIHHLLNQEELGKRLDQMQQGELGLYH
jgi:hypothetical protein